MDIRIKIIGTAFLIFALVSLVAWFAWFVIIHESIGEINKRTEQEINALPTPVIMQENLNDSLIGNIIVKDGSGAVHTYRYFSSVKKGQRIR